MGELSFLLQKVVREKEEQQIEWRVSQLKGSVIPHAEHEVEVLKQLGLPYVASENILKGLLREYHSLTGTKYHTQ